MYTIKDNGIMFMDNIFYKNSEIRILKNNPGFDYRLVHDVKDIFGAEVVE